jgi:organic radical activating enzyme
MNRHFCSAPWLGATFETDGTIRPCCFIDTDGLNIKEKNIDQYYNCNEVKELRKQFMNGEKPNLCRRCWMAESDNDSAPDSMRRRMNRFAKDRQLLDKISKVTKDDGTVTENIIGWADVSFSNKCNFSCIICGPSRSSIIEQKFLKEYRKLSGSEIPIILDNNIENEVFRWFESDGHKTVKMLVINGGEPFLQPGLYQLLDFMMKIGADKECELAISTNGSITKSPSGKDVISDYLRKWNNKIKLTMSIDHCGEQGEFLRPGFKEDLWLRNYSKFIKEEHVEIRTMVSLTMLNTPTIHKLFEMFSKNLDPRTVTNINLVGYPASISYGQLHLDKTLLNLSIASLEKSIELVKEFPEENAESIRSAKTALKTTFGARRYALPFFREGINAICQRKDISFLNIFPEHTNFWNLSLTSGKYPDTPLIK